MNVRAVLRATLAISVLLSGNLWAVPLAGESLADPDLP